MTREDFLKRLQRSLSNIPGEEQKRILYDYEEHFRSGTEKGHTEEHIATALGNPEILGKSLRIDYFLERGQPGSRLTNLLRAVLVSLSLGFLNIVISVPVFASLVSVVISLWAAAIALAASGLAVILAVIFHPLLPAFITLEGLSIPFLIFASIGVCALGVLAGIGMWRLSRWFVKLTAQYVQFNVKIVKKQEAEN